MTGGCDALVLWFYRAGHVLRLGNHSRLEGVDMRRFLLALFVALQLLLPSFSYATAFPVIRPTIQPNLPSIYPTAQAMPPGGGGTGSINDGKGIATAAVGAVAAAICFSVDCTSSMAMTGKGTAQPSGWPSDSSGAPTPPSTASASYPASDCGSPGGAWVLDHVASDGQCVYSSPLSQSLWATGYATGPATCPSGYAMGSGNSCTLSSSADVQKPANTPCQAIMSNGQPHWDTSNPACASHGAGPYWTDSDGNKESLDTGTGTFSVVSSDGKNKTTVGPGAGNSTPIVQELQGPDSTGTIHDFKSTTSIDSNGNITGQTYTIDGKPVTQDEYLKTLGGNPPSTTMENSTANTGSNAGTGSGSSSVNITCDQVGTCGVAQDSTLKDVAAKTGAIQTSLSDFFKNFTTAVAVPQLYTPSTSTAQSALTDFSAQIKATPIVTSVTGFFDVSFQGGACPTWTIPVVNVMGLSIGGIEIDQFCTPTAYRVYSIIAVVTLVVCGFFAFRVAVDN